MPERLQVRLRKSPDGEIQHLGQQPSIVEVWLGDREVTGLVDVNLSMRLNEALTATITAQVTVGHLEGESDA